MPWQVTLFSLAGEAPVVLGFLPAAHVVRAALIGCPDLPSLEQLVHDLRACGETWFSFLDVALSYGRPGDPVSLPWVRVRPTSVRRDVARAGAVRRGTR